jgi:hypothetical protein
MRGPPACDASVYAGALAGGAAARAAPRVLGASSVARLEALARARAPLRRVLARIAGRIVARRSWERLGFARIGDYARERAGLSGRQLLDLAHMDARLAELPAVEAAFVAGRLSWSKARLLARVARAGDEASWVAFAQRVPVRVLEREVRAVDLGSLEAGALEGDEDGAPRSPMTGVIVRCTPDVQGKFHRARWLAQRVAGERLPTWACMEAVAAEVVSALGVSAPEQDDLESDAAHPSGASWSDRRASPAATEADAREVCDVRDAIPAEAQASKADHGPADLCTPQPAAARDASAVCNAAPADGQASEPDRAPADVCVPKPVDVRDTDGIRNVIAADPQPGGTRRNRIPADVCAPQSSTRVHPVLDDARLDALLDGLDTADAFDLDARLRHAVALEARIDAEMAPLLRRVADGRLHRRVGCASAAAFARERLGMSERKARALVRIARLGAACPELEAAFARGALSWIQAQVLLPLLVLPESAPHRAAWVARAGQVTVRRLEDEVDAALAAGDLRPERQTCAQPRDPATPSPPADPDLDAQQAAHGALPAANGALPAAHDGNPRTPPVERARFFFAAPHDVARLFRAVACSVRRALEPRLGRPVTEGEAVGWMFDHAFASWGANDPRVRREHRVFERDGWRCTVPGCSSYRNLHDHHVVFRSAGGSDALANRTTLCAFHHLRGVHAGHVRCFGVAPAGLRFELGLHPERPPLLRFGPGERLLERCA